MALGDGNEAAREYIAPAHARTGITSTCWEPGMHVLSLFPWGRTSALSTDRRADERKFLERLA